MNNTNPQPTSDEPCVSDGRSATSDARAIVSESELKVRAGSPLGVLDPLNLTGTQQ